LITIASTVKLPVTDKKSSCIAARRMNCFESTKNMVERIKLPDHIE